MKKAIRAATICHNEDDYRDHNARRVRLELHRDAGAHAYIWRTCDGDDCLIAPQPTVAAACDAALNAWGAACWDLRASWRPEL